MTLYRGKSVRRRFYCPPYVLTPQLDEDGNYSVFTVPVGMMDFCFVDYFTANDWEIAE
jgi:hypothetical protein